LTGSREEQSDNLPGRLCSDSTPLRRTRSRAFRAASRARAASVTLGDFLGHRRVLLKIGGELIVDYLLHQSLDFGVAQLHLGLTLELGLGYLDADNADHALADIITGR
jgi:hypothetical protein